MLRDERVCVCVGWQCVRRVSTAKAADSDVRVPITPRVTDTRACVAVLPAGLELAVISVRTNIPPITFLLTTVFYVQTSLIYSNSVTSFCCRLVSLLGVRSIVMTDECACLSVHSHNSKATRPNLTKFFVHVAYGSDSILLWGRCNMLCTSVFVDDVMFSRSGHMARHVGLYSYKRRCNAISIRANMPS